MPAPRPQRSRRATRHPPAWGAETQFFYELTPDRILHAVESCGLRCTGRIHPLNSLENRVFALELESALPETSTHYVVAKFYRPGRWTRDQIQCEHDFLADLAEAEVPAVRPLAVHGQTLFTMQDTGLHFSIVPRVGGRTPDELDDEARLRVGRLLARIHRVGAQRPAHARLSLTLRHFGQASLDFLRHCPLVPDHWFSRIEIPALQILARAEPWWHGLQMQRIHGDAHLGNLLFTPDGPLWVDFDDMVMGPPVQDLWLLAAGRDEEARHQLDMLLRGYEELADFDRRTLRLIEVLRALRHLHFAAWVAKRWDDPAFPRAFPEFNTPAYWQTLASDLQDCRKHLPDDF